MILQPESQWNREITTYYYSFRVFLHSNHLRPHFLQHQSAITVLVRRSAPPLGNFLLVKANVVGSVDAARVQVSLGYVKRRLVRVLRRKPRATFTFAVITPKLDFFARLHAMSPEIFGAKGRLSIIMCGDTAGYGIDALAGKSESRASPKIDLFFCDVLRSFRLLLLLFSDSGKGAQSLRGRTETVGGNELER